MQGKVFGRLTTIHQVGKNKNGAALWLCQCVCGKRTTVPWTRLTSGATKGCGCFQGRHLRTHGYSKRPEYAAWATMMARCRNPNSVQYRWYGARGIKVCERWHKFENFFADVGERPSGGMTLDRINSDGNYEPGNVRWATRLQQAQNVRHNVNVTHLGRTQSIAMWHRETGISYKTLSSRWHAGLRGAALFKMESQASRAQRLAKRYTHDGKTLTLKSWSENVGIKESTIRYRLKHGWSFADAVGPLSRQRRC